MTGGEMFGLVVVVVGRGVGAGGVRGYVSMAWDCGRCGWEGGGAGGTSHLIRALVGPWWEGRGGEGEGLPGTSPLQCGGHITSLNYSRLGQWKCSSVA